MSLTIKIYRLGNFFYKNNFKVLAKLISGLNRLIFSVWLPSSSEIGDNFKIGYWGLGVVIHHNCKIGKNVTIAQNVTIGRNFGDNKVPIIGDDVYIGTGSVIFGEIVIGDNVIIGANTVVNKDIPNNCTVVGNPFRIIERDRSKKYYEYDVDRKIF